MSHLRSTVLSTLGRCRGITRKEIVLVLLIAAALTIYVSSLVRHRMNDALQDQASADLERIASALHQYKLDNLRYPSPDQGLFALLESPALEPSPANWSGPYVNRASLLRDPWKRDYLYHSSDSPPSFSLSTLGADGEPGGTEANSDIVVKFHSDADY